LGTFTYFLKFDFLNNLPEVRAYFQREFPNPLSREEEYFMLVGDPNENPSTSIIRSYELMESQNRFPVTLVGFVRLNARWFSNLLERYHSVEYYDILVKWGHNVVSWLQNTVDNDLMMALISVGLSREPKIYFVFKPQFFDKNEMTLTRAHQYLVLSELEDRFIKYMITMGLPAVSDLQDIVYMTRKDWGYARMRVRNWDLPDPPEYDIRRTLTFKDYFLFLVGGNGLKQRLGELYATAKTFFFFNEFFMRTERQEYLRACSHMNDYYVNQNKSNNIKELKRSSGESLRGPDPIQVLWRLYGIRQAPTKDHKDTTYEAITQNGLRICLRALDWYVEGTDISGKGSIQLVNYLSGYPKEDHSSAVHELSALFPKESIQKSMLFEMRFSIGKALDSYLSKPYALPILSEDLWSEYCEKLIKYMRVPKNYLDFLHQQGIVLADTKGAVLFVCDQKSGAFRLIFKNKNEFGSLEQPDSMSLPFYLPGTTERVIITENPVIAVKVKAQQFQHSVIAYGSHTPMNHLLMYLHCQEIVVHCEHNAVIPKALTDFLTYYDFTFLVQFGYTFDKKSFESP
jgi:hypothetical protein